MGKTRTQKAALNTATAAVSEVVQVVCSLILPRLILANFGSAYNGITNSARQFLSAVSILTVGVAGSTRVALYRSLEAKDKQRTSAIVRATELYMHKVGLVLLGLIAVLTVAYPLLVDTGYSWIEVAPLIVAAGVSASGRYFFGTTYSALLSADQSVYISNIFLITANIMNVVVSVILIRMGASIQVVKLCASVVLLMSPLLRAIYVRKRYELDRRVAPERSALTMRRDAMAHSIANIVHDHTDIVVLTIFCNVRIVSVYTVYNLVMGALKRTQQVFTSGTEAIFGNMWVKGETDKIRRSLGYYEYIISTFASVVFSTALVMILPFISLYTKGVHDVEYLLPTYAAVITVAQMFFSFRTPYLTLVQGVGHYKQTKKGAYAEAAINLILSVTLVQFIGIVGVAVGTLAANIFRTLQYAIYADNHIIKRGKTVFAGRILWACANIAVIYFICSRTAAQFAYSGWLAWVMTAAVVTAIGAAITVASSFVFYRGDMKAVFQLALRSIRKRKK